MTSQWRRSLVIAGFITGLIVFFPIRIFTGQIEMLVRQNTGMDLRLGETTIGTGFSMGLLRGGLLALKAQNSRLGIPGSGDFECDELVLSPHGAALFLGKIEVAIDCVQKPASHWTVVAAASPFWSPSQGHVQVFLDSFNLVHLEQAFRLSGGLAGLVDGTIEISAPLVTQNRVIPEVTWTVKAKNLQTPGFTNTLLTLPPIPLETLETSGTVAANGKGNLKQFVFGTAKTPLEGELSAIFELEPSGMPRSLDLNGKLRTAPEFEKNSLKDLNLDLIFGKTKDNGLREFKKSSRGNLMSLFFEPPSP